MLDNLIDEVISQAEKISKLEQEVSYLRLRLREALTCIEKLRTLGYLEEDSQYDYFPKSVRDEFLRILKNNLT